VIPIDEPMRFGAQTALIEMPINWSLDAFPHFKYLCTQVLMATSGVLANWVDDFEQNDARDRYWAF